MNVEATSSLNKRKVHRSPNYPAISLGDAIEKARQIYEAEKRSPSSADTLLSHWGYKPGVGPGLRVLSALRQYGLLEDHSGQLRISDAAFHILTLSESSPDRQNAIREAANRPALFRQLLDHFMSGLPSDVNLRDYLIKIHSFNPESIPTFIKALRETVELAKLTISEQDGHEVDADMVGTVEKGTPRPNFFAEITNRDPEISKRAMDRLVAAIEERELLRYTLSGGRGVRLIFTGPVPTQDQIEELLDLVKVSKRTFPVTDKQ